MPTATRCRFVRTGNVFRRGLKALDANEPSFGRIRSGDCLERVVFYVISRSVARLKSGWALISLVLNIVLYISP